VHETTIQNSSKDYELRIQNLQLLIEDKNLIDQKLKDDQVLEIDKLHNSKMELENR